MSEERHERLEGHSGVDECSGVGVAQLVWGDVADPGGFGAAGEFGTHGGLGEAAAVVGEQELGGSTGSWMRQRAAWGAGGGDTVDERYGFVVEGDHAFGVELAERDLEPGSVFGDLVDAVEFKVQQFADA